MMILAKVALGFASTVVLAGAYTFREGVIRIDVDEHRHDGAHVHLWVPAAVIPMAMHLAPRHKMLQATQHAQEFLPTATVLIKQLKRFPDAEFVDVIDGEQHVRVRTSHGKLQIDVTDPEENVHILCPLSTIEDLTTQLDENRSTV